jgi:hypothetical protein
MEPEERHMLEKVLRITEHNNRILRHMRREILIMRFIHILYWLLIMGALIAGYYYFVEPYLGSAMFLLDKIK